MSRALLTPYFLGDATLSRDVTQESGMPSTAFP